MRSPTGPPTSASAWPAAAKRSPSSRATGGTPALAVRPSRPPSGGPDGRAGGRAGERPGGRPPGPHAVLDTLPKGRRGRPGLQPRSLEWPDAATVPPTHPAPAVGRGDVGG